MKNWVITSDKEFVYKLGEFFIQITTMESILEEIYYDFVSCKTCTTEFQDGTLGKKITILTKKIKLGSMGVELKQILRWRNALAHEVVNYDSDNGMISIKSESRLDLDEYNENISKLITNLYIFKLSLVKEGFRESITI